MATMATTLDYASTVKFVVVVVVVVVVVTMDLI